MTEKYSENILKMLKEENHKEKDRENIDAEQN
jgi:hypothetical protein